MEITSDHRYPGVNTADERKLHSTAFNTDGPTDWHFENPDKAAIIDSHARRVSEGGGVHVLNHPNYRFQVELRDILDAPNVGLMEIANVHPRSNHAGHGGFRPAIEELWDQLLSNGRTIYGVASDDAHDFKWHRVMLRRFGYAPPGGAWVMVRATELDPASIGQALKDGEFYASTGVHLRNVTATDDFYSVELDRERTEAETARAWVRDAAPVVWSTDGHFVIEFIGEWGRVLHSVHDREQARIALDPENRYVRARVTYLEKMRGRDRARAFHAWTQPVMISGPNSEEKL